MHQTTIRHQVYRQRGADHELILEEAAGSSLDAEGRPARVISWRARPVTRDARGLLSFGEPIEVNASELVATGRVITTEC